MQKYIVIVLKDKVIDKILVDGKNDSEIHDKAFDYADTRYGQNNQYELYDLGHPRHQVLFENINKELFN